MKLKSKKFISLFLAFSLIMLSVNLYAKERRGAKLIVTKKDGQQIEGELITVKPKSLLLLDTEGKDFSVGIADIKVLRIMKKSKAWIGAGIGFLIGAGAGALIGALAGSPGEEFSELEWAMICGVGTGLPSALVGGIFGAYVGTDKTIQIEGMTDLEIQETMDKLRKKARIRDYR